MYFCRKKFKNGIFMLMEDSWRKFRLKFLFWVFLNQIKVNQEQAKKKRYNKKASGTASFNVKSIVRTHRAWRGGLAAARFPQCSVIWTLGAVSKIQIFEFWSINHELSFGRVTRSVTRSVGEVQSNMANRSDSSALPCPSIFFLNLQYPLSQGSRR